jgi:hypothetical protein
MPSQHVLRGMRCLSYNQTNLHSCFMYSYYKNRQQQAHIAVWKGAGPECSHSQAPMFAAAAAAAATADIDTQALDWALQLDGSSSGVLLTQCASTHGVCY